MTSATAARSVGDIRNVDRKERPCVVSYSLPSLSRVVSAGVEVAASASAGPRISGPRAMGAAKASPLTADVVAGRLATAKYATNLARAKADGYGIITQTIPDMGYHFLNPKVSGFSVGRPPILVYEHHGNTWQLGALVTCSSRSRASRRSPAPNTARLELRACLRARHFDCASSRRAMTRCSDATFDDRGRLLPPTRVRGTDLAPVPAVAARPGVVLAATSRRQ